MKSTVLCIFFVVERLAVDWQTYMIQLGYSRELEPFCLFVSMFKKVSYITVVVLQKIHDNF